MNMLTRMVCKSILVMSLTLLFTVQNAQWGAARDRKTMTKEEAREVLKVIAPDVTVISIERAPVEGLWEVVISTGGRKGIAYIDFARKNIVLGSILDAATKTNLTKEKFDEINKIDVSLIPLEDSVVMGNPEAERKVVVFDDPH